MTFFRRGGLVVGAALLVLALGAFSLGYIGAGESEKDARRAAQAKGYRDGKEVGKRDGRTAGRKDGRASQAIAEPASGETASPGEVSTNDPDPNDEIDPSDESDCPSTGPLPLARQEACGL